MSGGKRSLSGGWSGPLPTSVGRTLCREPIQESCIHACTCTCVHVRMLMIFFALLLTIIAGAFGNVITVLLLKIQHENNNIA